MTAEAPISSVAPGLGALRPAPAGLPDADLAPPVVAESRDPFTALRVIHLLARIERGRPIRIADVVDRLNATLPRLDLPARGRRRRRGRPPVELAGRLPERLGDRPRGRPVRRHDRIEDSSRVDPWIVRQAERERAACRERLAAFSRLDRTSGEG